MLMSLNLLCKFMARTSIHVTLLIYYDYVNHGQRSTASTPVLTTVVSLVCFISELLIVLALF